MNTILVGCETIHNEIKAALEKTNCDFPMVWIESGLHNFPEKLNKRLQETLDSLKGVDLVLFAFGYCGNSIAGLKARDFELIIPRVDDCISLLLGSCKRRQSITQGNGTYFLTEGWLEGEQNIWVEYQYTINKYGEKRGKTIYKMLLEHYKCLGVLDTGAYELNSLLKTTTHIADTLELEHRVIDASVDYLCDLITGPWPDNRFLTVAENTEITLARLML